MSWTSSLTEPSVAVDFFRSAWQCSLWIFYDFLSVANTSILLHLRYLRPSIWTSDIVLVLALFAFALGPWYVTVRTWMHICPPQMAPWCALARQETLSLERTSSSCRLSSHFMAHAFVDWGTCTAVCTLVGNLLGAEESFVSLFANPKIHPIFPEENHRIRPLLYTSGLFSLVWAQDQGLTRNIQELIHTDSMT